MVDFRGHTGHHLTVSSQLAIAIMWLVIAVSCLQYTVLRLNLPRRVSTMGWVLRHSGFRISVVGLGQVKASVGGIGFNFGF